MIVSPLSVENALVLLSQGTSGYTFEQLKTRLHLSSDKEISANQFLENREILESNAGESTISIANRIYVQQGQQLNKYFQEVAVTKFKSGVESLNFVESQKSAATINHFVEENTNGKIKELIKSDQLDSNTRLILVNAIYFKGNWEKPFLKDATYKNDFFNSETETVSVDFMYVNDEYNYVYLTDLEAEAIEMKYANSNTSFVIVLPKSRTGLVSLEVKLKDYDLTKITENMKTDRYEVQIPKFKAEYEIKLNNVLKDVSIFMGA